MELGKMRRRGHAVDNYAIPTTAISSPVAETTPEPVVVEKIVERIVEKPVYVDRVVEKIVEVPVPAEPESKSSFFDDFVPTEWAEAPVENESRQKVS